jgi:hypothetical protein
MGAQPDLLANTDEGPATGTQGTVSDGDNSVHSVTLVTPVTSDSAQRYFSITSNSTMAETGAIRGHPATSSYRSTTATAASITDSSPA